MESPNGTMLQAKLMIALNLNTPIGLDSGNGDL